MLGFYCKVIPFLFWLMQSERLPVVTILVEGNVEDTFRASWDNKLSRVLIWSGQKDRPSRAQYRVFSEMCSSMPDDSDSASAKATRSAAVVYTHYRGQFSHILDLVSGDDKHDALVMIEERVKLVFLIDTPGGCINAEKKLVRYANRVRKNGGEVWAFGKQKVSSAGATVFMHADRKRRWLEENTSLYFHLSTAAKRNGVNGIDEMQMEGNRADEIVAMKKLLANACVDQCCATYLERMIETSNSKVPLGKDVEWRFSAKEAQQLWQVGRLSPEHLSIAYKGVFGDEVLAQTFLASREAKAIQRFISAGI